HNNLNRHDTRNISNYRRRPIHFVGLSRSHVSAHPEAENFRVIHNARDLDTLPFSPAPAVPPYLVFLGRLTRDKGIHRAIEIARQAGLKLVIGGNIPQEPGAVDFFEMEIKPRLGPACEWIGPYDNSIRAKILPGATALLFPIQWQEPFGSVMIEALACGVPVIASRMASTPEVITHGETGFLCDSTAEMVAAVHRINEISRRRCRAEAEQRFGETAFMNQLEKLLHEAVACPYCRDDAFPVF
ncbi:MAG: glycosyltransferase, partial [Opitutaceae bacterium]